jgi:hypothetical protein
VAFVKQRQENYAVCIVSNCNSKESGQAQGEVRDFLVKWVKQMRPGRR